MKQKPNLTFWQLWNISVGYIGIQLGFSIQGQSSRVFSSLGAADDQIALLWLGAPLAGLIAQPLIGLFADRTWVKGLGRRIPYLLIGGLMATLALCFFVNPQLAPIFMPAYLFAAVMLLLKDVAFNSSMLSMRSLVADMAPEKQHNKGFSMQMALANFGAIIGFGLPFFLASIGVRNEPDAALGEMLPPSLVWSYYIGAGVILMTIVWTTLRVKEHPPKEFAEYNGMTEEEAKKKDSLLTTLKNTPKVIFQIAVVQFFTWFGLMMLWTYAVNGIGENAFGAIDRTSVEFQNAGNWWGIMGAVQSIVAVVFAIVMIKLADKIGRKAVYSISLLFGAVGLMSMYFIGNPHLLLGSIVGMGIATAGMNAMPFAILSSQLPAKKIGIYLGIFNLSIVIPQIIHAITGGTIFRFVESFTTEGTTNITMVFIAGTCLFIASMLVFIIKDKTDVATPQPGDN